MGIFGGARMSLDPQQKTALESVAQSTHSQDASGGTRATSVEGYDAQQLMLRPEAAGGYAEQAAQLSPGQGAEQDVDEEVVAALAPGNKPGGAKADAKGAKKAAPKPQPAAAAKNVDMKGGKSVSQQRSGKGDGAYAKYSKSADARAIEMNTGEMNSLPDNVIGAYQKRRVVHALGALSADDYAKFAKVKRAAQSPSERAFLFKALAAGNSIANITWLAGKISGKDQNWLLDNCTLGDPRAQGTGVRQQWTHSCGPSATLTMRGNYDPVFALKLREGNTNVNTDDQGTSNADLGKREKALLEAGGGTAVRTGQTGGVGMWATHVVVRYNRHKVVGGDGWHARACFV